MWLFDICIILIKTSRWRNMYRKKYKFSYRYYCGFSIFFIKIFFLWNIMYILKIYLCWNYCENPFVLKCLLPVNTYSKILKSVSSYYIWRLLICIYEFNNLRTILAELPHICYTYGFFPYKYVKKVVIIYLN